jgi:hypothetical protein
MRQTCENHQRILMLCIHALSGSDVQPSFCVRNDGIPLRCTTSHTTIFGSEEAVRKVDPQGPNYSKKVPLRSPDSGVSGLIIFRTRGSQMPGKVALHELIKIYLSIAWSTKKIYNSKHFQRKHILAKGSLGRKVFFASQLIELQMKSRDIQRRDIKNDICNLHFKELGPSRHDQAIHFHERFARSHIKSFSSDCRLSISELAIRKIRMPSNLYFTIESWNQVDEPRVLERWIRHFEYLTWTWWWSDLWHQHMRMLHKD